MTTKKGESYLVNTNATKSDYASGNSYTAEYLKNVVKNSIENCEKEFTYAVLQQIIFSAQRLVHPISK